MSVEQRLVSALRTTDRVEPSEDLWTRVVHSIDEDRAHRRRIEMSVVAVVAAAIVLLGIGLAGLVDGPLGRRVRLPVMELIETLALGVLIAVLGPAIRRFGRGYAGDLWRSTPETASALVRLLDVAYLLVFGGFVLVTAQFDVDTSAVVAAEQVQDFALRVGGLLLIMGLLHASTIMVLPLVALVSNSTRAGAALPRWLVIALIIGAVIAGPPLLMMLGGALVGVAGS